LNLITVDVRTEILDNNEPAQAAAALADADVLLTGAWRSRFPAAPKLRLLQVPLAGTDGIDVSSLPRGVTLCNAYGHEPALGEFAIMMMLAWCHRLFDIATSFREGSWSWSPMVGGAVRGEIGGQTVGVVGLGHIGREVAWRAAALGCRVLAVNRTTREKPASVEQVFSWTELDRMLGESDIVVLSCALTPETMGLIDGRRLAAMKPSAFLINLARGPIAEEQALYRALRDGVIGGAALDTWWRYPSADDPAPRPSRYRFHELPNVIMTPHCSPRTDGTIERRSRDVAPRRVIGRAAAVHLHLIGKNGTPIASIEVHVGTDEPILGFEWHPKDDHEWHRGSQRVPIVRTIHCDLPHHLPAEYCWFLCPETKKNGQVCGRRCAAVRRQRDPWFRLQAMPEFGL
jgi:phosphoglycerate dehydrogenase-like enzyme